MNLIFEPIRIFYKHILLHNLTMIQHSQEHEATAKYLYDAAVYQDIAGHLDFHLLTDIYRTLSSLCVSQFLLVYHC